MDNDKNCANDLNCNNVQYGKTKEIGKVEELSKADELRKVEDIANKIAKERGILDYKLQIVKGSMKGDNYIGVIHCVDVIGANETLHLIVKTALTNENLRREFQVRELFEREIYAYSKLFKLYDCLLDGTNIKPSYPKCYYTSEETSEEIIVLENLKTIGYKLWNRKIPMNVEHALVVLTEYGRLHALSCALKRHEPVKYEEIYRRIETHPFVAMFDHFDVPTYATFDKLLSLFDVDGADDDDKRVANCLRKVKENVMDYFKSVMVPKPEDTTVVLHGDCWTNNMLFNYEGTNPSKPTGLSLIDFQVIRIGIPVQDLLHFVYSCASKEVLDVLDDCLKVYYESFARQMVALDCDPERDGFTYETLRNSWLKEVRYGIIMALNFIRLMISDSSEIPDFEQIADDGKDIFQEMHYPMSEEDEYKRRIKDLILHVLERNFL